MKTPMNIFLDTPVYTISEIEKIENNNNYKLNLYNEDPNESVTIETIRSLMIGRVSSAFLPQQIFSCLLGRFPFKISYSSTRILKKPEESRRLLLLVLIDFLLKSFHWIYFILTSIGLLFTLILITLGFAMFYLSWNFFGKSEHYDHELQLFNANLVPFVIFWGCLLHATIGSISFIWNRKHIVKYFKVWNKVVDLIHVPFPTSIRKYLIIANIFIFSFFLLLVLFYQINYVPVVRGVANLVRLLVLRPFYPSSLDLIISKQFTSGGPMGIVLVIYVVYASRSLLFLFTFKCRLLRLCFDTWNHRLRDELTYNVKERKNEIRERMTCNRLFRDHCILIKMIRKTDIVFASILQSYYLTQVLNMCFELYYLARTDCFSRTTEDIVAGILLIGQTFFIFFTVSLEGAYVNDSAMEGFQILRLRGIQVMDSMEKKYLIQNLLVNYSQNIILTGGKFFCLDRPFIIKVLGAVFTYFVIILQFGSQIGGDCSSSTTIH